MKKSVWVRKNKLSIDLAGKTRVHPITECHNNQIIE